MQFPILFVLLAELVAGVKLSFQAVPAGGTQCQKTYLDKDVNYVVALAVTVRRASLHHSLSPILPSPRLNTWTDIIQRPTKGRPAYIWVQNPFVQNSVQPSLAVVQGTAGEDYMLAPFSAEFNVCAYNPSRIYGNTLDCNVALVC